jgi:hypothetical protein
MTERRRFNRASCDTIVSLTICDTYKIKKRNDSPVTSAMIDFSLHGACLLPDKIEYGGQHIFKATQHHSDYIVRIEYTPDDKDDPLIIYGNSSWYNQSSQADSIRFKLGIEFLKNQNQDILHNFYTKLANRQNAQKGWLRKLLRY